MEQHIEYAAKLTHHIAEIFEEESNNYINLQELKNEDNAAAFLHALATMVPARFYEKILNQPLTDHLEFNHLANRMCVQFQNFEREEDKG